MLTINNHLSFIFAILHNSTLVFIPIILSSLFKGVNNYFKSIVFDKQRKVAGLWFNYGEKDTTVTSTSNTAKATEYRFYLVDGIYKLPAILTLPLNDKNCTDVILVQDSDPSDMDETDDISSWIKKV
jgi:hypothetical protein